ncbi:flagellar brake protein [Massilia brevitalea]|uniref:flagellar brake protein n=1 Tax=Massilia brevitalea TaxID=442526 RepID=UPI00273833CD|nr:flagellar brake protein [Massilia brevitalea]
MQAIHDADSDDWRDYEVRSRKEIIALLRQIGEKKQLIRMKIKGEADVCVTSVLEVDAERGALILDRSIDREQNERILRAGQVMCETYLDKIRILFRATGLQERAFAGAAALAAQLPEALIRLQRREFYRVATPVSNPVQVFIPTPPELGGGDASFPLSDIGAGGLALLDNKMILNAIVGQSFDGCRIELPDAGIVHTTLQVRNAIELTMLNNKTSRRVGCMFTDMPRSDMAALQRYITRLERERNARLAGLA